MKAIYVFFLFFLFVALPPELAQAQEPRKRLRVINPLPPNPQWGDQKSRSTFGDFLVQDTDAERALEELFYFGNALSVSFSYHYSLSTPMHMPTNLQISSPPNSPSTSPPNSPPTSPPNSPVSTLADQPTGHSITPSFAFSTTPPTGKPSPSRSDFPTLPPFGLTDAPTAIPKISTMPTVVPTSVVSIGDTNEDLQALDVNSSSVTAAAADNFSPGDHSNKSSNKSKAPIVSVLSVAAVCMVGALVARKVYMSRKNPSDNFGNTEGSEYA